MCDGDTSKYERHRCYILGSTGRESAFSTKIKEQMSPEILGERKGQLVTDHRE